MQGEIHWSPKQYTRNITPPNNARPRGASGKQSQLPAFQQPRHIWPWKNLSTKSPSFYLIFSHLSFINSMKQSVTDGVFSFYLSINRNIKQTLIFLTMQVCVPAIWNTAKIISRKKDGSLFWQFCDTKRFIQVSKNIKAGWPHTQSARRVCSLNKPIVVPEVI